MPNISALGLDTSNYTTSAAFFGDGEMDSRGMILPVKEGEIGLRQSDAVFHHTRQLPEVLSMLGDKISGAKVIGVSERPRDAKDSYMPCFLAGVNAAASFAMAKDIPVVQTTHQQGHITAALYAAAGRELFSAPALVFHISGGTTDLLYCKSIHEIECIGTSSDLYAGQAVDRIGVKLGFEFPAGVMVSQLAAQCTEKITPKSSVNGTQCSLSGLENQCTALLAQGKSNEYVCKYCLLCIGQTVVRMTKAALQQYPGLPVVCAGGVMSSSIIADYVRARLPKVYFVPGKYSSDNAIGVSILAAEDWLNA